MPHEMKPHSGGYDVLVIDDQPMIIEAVRRCLASDANARIHGCNLAVEAVQRALALRPAVILQDLTMPDGNGLDLVSSYRSEATLSETSIVVLSATEDAHIKAEAFARGAADYIEKLPPPAEFIARVQHHALASRALSARNAAMRALEAKDKELQIRNAMLDEANERLKCVNQELVVDIGAQRQKVEALAAVGSGLASIQDLDVLLGTILDEAARFSGATAGAVFVCEDDELRAATLYSNGASRAADPRLPRIRVGSGMVVGEIAASGEALRVARTDLSHAGMCLAPDGMLPPKFSSLLILPIARGVHVLGVLALCNANDNDEFTAEDERLLRHFAGLVAVALERAQAARALIFRMVAMAALRDPTETAGHVQRVAGISEILFDAWALTHELSAVESAQQLDLLRIAAILHDVGKVGIADAILKKPGKLDGSERAAMERHAEIGAGLFSELRSDLDESAAEVALCHHEKWDGTGYPRGLRGDAIPIFARIVAVADVYDALGSRRSYKEPWPRERIEKLFAEEAGKHFDPDLTKILLAHIDEVERVRDAFSEQIPNTK